MKLRQTLVAGGLSLYTFACADDHPRIEVRRGDLVEVAGHTTRGGFAPNVRPENVRKLGVSDRTEAATAALQRGIVQLGG